MAATKKQTKSKPEGKSKPKAASKGKGTAKGAAKQAKGASRPKAAASKAVPKPKAEVVEKIAGKAAKAAEGTSLGPGVNAVLAGRAALAGTHAAGQAAKIAAARAKVPLVAGGGMIAGVAGGLAVVRRRNARTSQVTFDVDRVIAAARRAGSFGEELGRMASLMEQASSGSKRK